MLSSTIRELLKSIESYDAASIAAKEAFHNEMERRQYGYEQLLSAWLWFICGWKARKAAQYRPTIK